MAVIIHFFDSFLSMLQDAIEAFRPARPAKPEPAPEYWMALGVKHHIQLEQAMRSFHESLERLESNVDRIERKVDEYLAACER